jgi:hypothetical protein
MELHPLHERFIKRFCGNSVGRLLRLLDSLEPAKKRDETVMLMAMEILKPKIRESESVHDTMNTRMEEHLSFNRFKDGVNGLQGLIPDGLLVGGIVHHILGRICILAFRDADKDVAEQQADIEHWTEQIATETVDWKKKSLQDLIDKWNAKIKTTHQDVREWQDFYVGFCEHVLGGLEKEDKEQSKRVRDQMRESMGDLDDLSAEEFPGAPKEP